MGEPLTKYWVNKHSMVGEHSPMRTSSDVPMYMAADVGQVLCWIFDTLSDDDVTNQNNKVVGVLLKIQRLMAQLEGESR